MTAPGSAVQRGPAHKPIPRARWGPG